MASTVHPSDRGFGPHVLREYALLADGERGVIVGPHGDYAWMCAPRWDSGAVFSLLIGGRSVYAVTPADTFVWSGHYEQGTLIWRSRWVTTDGIVECREALAFPGDPHRVVLLRRIAATDAPARVRVRLAPAAEFDRHKMRALRRDDAGTWHARLGDLRVRWSGGAEAVPADGGLEMELSLAAGECHDLVLEISDAALPDEPPDADTRWTATEAAWHAQVPRLDGTLAPRDAQHAYAVLRGLTGSAGGMVAAATTNLPERAEEGRNYDYRYVWIRDQCYAAHAAAAVGDERLCTDAVRFITARLLEHGSHLAPAYAVDGKRIPRPSRVDLPGYPGGFDQVGNQVTDQLQLDAFGESLLVLANAAREGRLDTDGQRAALTAAHAIAERWQEPDAGVWELAPRRWAHSRLICAAGLRAITGTLILGDRTGHYTALADRLVAETDKDCLHPSGRWQRSAADPGLDGALLLPPLRGAIPADDPRTVATLRTYTRELTDDYYAYRFRHDQRPLGEAEGAFLLCGFITALAEHQQGNHVEAARWFERNRSACGPAGLYAEEYDVAQRQLRGNLPQAFVHALMLESAGRLADPRYQA